MPYLESGMSNPHDWTPQEREAYARKLEDDWRAYCQRQWGLYEEERRIMEFFARDAK